VDHNKTGIICTNEDDFVSAMRAMQDDAFRRDLKKNIKSYYQKSFNWQTNLERLLKGMEKSKLF
jgi:glycosyltransferase involved in cell wall biosynthesis